MSERFLGTDVWGQVGETISFEGDDIRVSWNGDNTAFEEARKALRNETDNGFTKSRDLRLIGFVGPAEIMMISQMYGVRPLSKEFDEVVLKLFNDPDWKHLKTTSGRVRSTTRAPKWV